MRKNFNFLDKTGKSINCYKWFPKNYNKIKGVIQIAHGMTENSLRYDYFANIMCKKGYLVYMNDHRGHGLTAKNKEELGYLGDGNGFALMVENMHELTNIIKEENPSLNIILLGHSMGSFLSQRYIQLYGSDIQGLILSGTNGKPAFKTNFGILLAKLEMCLKDKNNKSKLLDKLSFGNFNNKFKPCKTNFDWLCSVEDEVNKYIEDEYCGFICTSSFYYYFFRGLKEIHKNENLKLIPKKLPIYIFAGDKDPVGNFGRGILDLFLTLKKQDVTNIEYKIYKNGRHEMLNEFNKDEVICDILKWINKNLNF